MNNYIFLGIALAVIVAIVVIKNFLDSGETKQNNFQYKRKDFFLSRAEHECYNALVGVVGERYYVFVQVHLSSILNHKVAGQKSRSAFNHINQKSVDFVLCDKEYISPRLAIELDDTTHERSERKERDREVERILLKTGLPLLRLENHGTFDPAILAQQISAILTSMA